MKLLLVAAACLSLTAAHGLNSTDEHDHHDHDHVHDPRTCGTVEDPDELLQSDIVAKNFLSRVCTHQNLTHMRLCQPYEERVKQPVTINVWYHVIHSGATGRLTDKQVQDQFEQTNKDFSGQEKPSIPGAVKMDITFALAGVTYTDNAAWFNDIDRYERQIKQALAVDNTYNFNQYFGNFGAGLLGFCYFPNSFTESNFMHGCMNLYSSVPGGSSTNYNAGKTTTHETGHGIGLYHTFQGGCNGQGDMVADTCNQASSTNGCPASRDSCRDGCPDPINNYMDYSYDSCMTQFTAGQNDRANQQLSTFRPSLYLGEEGVKLIQQHIPDAWTEARTHAKVIEAKKLAAKPV